MNLGGWVCFSISLSLSLSFTSLQYDQGIHGALFTVKTLDQSSAPIFRKEEDEISTLVSHEIKMFTSRHREDKVL